MNDTRAAATQRWGRSGVSQCASFSPFWKGTPRDLAISICRALPLFLTYSLWPNKMGVALSYTLLCVCAYSNGSSGRAKNVSLIWPGPCRLCRRPPLCAAARRRLHICPARRGYVPDAYGNCGRVERREGVCLLASDRPTARLALVLLSLSCDTRKITWC